LDYLPNRCFPNIFLRYEMDVDLRVWMIAPYRQIAVSVLLFAMLFSSQKTTAEVAEDWHTWASS
jgi:hypothetical protein